jgi:hypothetical protein
LYSTLYRNFRVISEDEGNQTYPGGELFIRIWNYRIQSQMLIDILKFSNNAVVGLPDESIHSYWPDIVSAVQFKGTGAKIVIF